MCQNCTLDSIVLLDDAFYMVPTILIVDDERHTREGLMQVLEDQYDVYLAEDVEQAFNLMESESFDMVLTDLRMPGRSGMKVIDKALALPNRPPVIMMTAYGDVDSAVNAMKHGAYDFLTKPVNLEKLEILIKRALQSRVLEVEVQHLHERLDVKFSFDGIIGSSPELKKVIERVKLVAPSRANVLIEGDTGTGKELVAQAIHQNGNRAKGPFVAVHCAALPANLLESELFGHEKGAFTGATERRIGRFEAAAGGTLFLDEIGEIDFSTQVKLLRFIEERTFERIGSSKPLKVDVRLVAATNKDLLAMTKEGTFREDLYYRLNVVQIRMPSLRDRAEDLPQLLNHFLDEFARENEVEAPTFEPGAVQCLRRYSWPGNIRELRNFAENVVVLYRGGPIHDYDLEPKFRGEASSIDGSGKVVSPLDKKENEKRLLREALADARGNRTRAAALLGVSRRTLHRKLRQWPELDVLDR